MGSGQGCGIKFLKFLLIFFNILFMVFGIAIIAAGSYTIAQVSGNALNLAEDVRTTVLGVGIAFLILGLIIFLISGLGCLGACRGNKCMLYTFAVIISVILIAQIAVAIAAFVYQGAIQEQVDKALSTEYDKFVFENSTQIADVIAAFQNQVECCGYNETNRLTVLASGMTVVTDSCYPDNVPKIVTNAYGSCRMRFIDLIKSYYLIVGGIGIAFALIELLGVIFACCVARHEDLDKIA